MTTAGMNVSSDISDILVSSSDEVRANSHTVQFYEQDAVLIDALSRRVGTALVAGDSAVVIATEEHRKALRDRLSVSGLDLSVASRQGRFVELDAAATLAQFMVKDRPDSERFNKLVAGTIEKARAAALTQNPRLIAFGEMVALLWAEGKQPAALELERFWNRLSETHDFQLHCAYPVGLFSEKSDGRGIEEIRSEHSRFAPAELALQESEERYRAIIEATPECVRTVALDGTLLQINPAGMAMFGAERSDDLVGKSFYDVIAPEDRERFRKFNERICRGARGSLEFEAVGLKGVRLHMESHAVPLRRADGSTVQLAITRDITSRREAAEAQRRLAAIVESSDDAIASKDLNGIVTSWNKGAERMFGYKAEEIVGKPILMIIPPELHRDEEMILGKIRRGEKIDHFETVRVRKDGERIDVSLTISPVKDEGGHVIGAAKIVRDVTENKKIERTLRTAEKLAAAGRLAATVAHEINNPLEAVSNLVYLAKRNLEDEKSAAGFLEMATRELDRVAHIARQTLGFYRDTSSPLRFSVTSAIDDLLILYEKRFESRGIRVVKQYQDDIEITALAGEIRQAFSNLISNAIDAMPSGGSFVIRVSESRQWNMPKVRGVRVTMVDTGTGIAPQYMRRLFQPFFTTKSDVGTGLGLWITRNIVRKSGGSIQVKTRTGEWPGTAFSIFLPFEKAETRKRKKIAA